MLKPKARTLMSQGLAASTTKDNLIDHSLMDESYDTPFVRTPGSESSAFEKVPPSPPKIQRKVRVDGDGQLAFDIKSFSTPEPTTAIQVGKGKAQSSPCDTTQDLSLHSHESPLAEELRQGKGTWGKSDAFKIQVKQMKKNLPKALKAMNRGPSKKSTSVDLADLAIATIYLAPRHGAGIAVGRKPFERMRTSLILHMVHQNQNASWEKEISDDTEGKNAKNGKAQVAKLNTLLRNCIAGKGTFVEKSQEVVRLAKDTLEELKDGGKSLAKTDLGKRNLTCTQYLSGMYREVISQEKNGPSQDGLSLMLVASAYYALGKFEPALSVYQRAGIRLKEQMANSTEYTIVCAKLFNNIGCVYFEIGKYEKAMQNFQRALQLFHNSRLNYAAWNAAISDQSSIMNNMAYVLIKFKQYDDASDLVDASFELQQIIPGTTNTLTISTLGTMAFIYYRTKKYKLSLDTYSACVQLQDQSESFNEADQVQTLWKMADICKKTCDHEKRIYLLRCILVYQQCYLMEDDDEFWETNTALAESLQSFADSGGTTLEVGKAGI